MDHQQQFLNVVDLDVAQQRFHDAIDLAPLGMEEVELGNALQRVLAADVLAPVDVPSFDRSNLDGFAVQAASTLGATEEQPRELQLLKGSIAAGDAPTVSIGPGQALPVATGGMLPRGCDAILMVEHADTSGKVVLARRALSAGAGVAFAGSDISRGETVARQGDQLTSRETGVLAATGVAAVTVWRRPRVALISTGNEIIPPGSEMKPGMIYDSNSRILADAVRETGGEPVFLGIARDNLEQLRQRLADALKTNDMVVLSGGTSKGQGDICYHAVAELSDPGIVAHGVALKPGKPVCLAGTAGKPVVILPGFPTSAIFTFHEFVAPVIRRLAGLQPESRATLIAEMAVKVNSETGRTEYLLVSLAQKSDTAGKLANDTPRETSSGGGTAMLSAYPMGKGSGSVTTFSRADGFITIGRHQEFVEAGSRVEVQLLGRDMRLADFVAIGSHCVGLDLLLGELQRRGFKVKLLATGSTAGLQAARRGECDIAGVHLLDEATGQYNTPFLEEGLQLISGYQRQQGVLCRSDDPRGAGDAKQAAAAFIADSDAMMVNRNQGSGTRIIIEQLLAGATPPGYAVQARNHHAVAAAIQQGRGDWGVAIQAVVTPGLKFLPLVAEHYDFVTPVSRQHRPAMVAFRQLLQSSSIQQQLAAKGLTPLPPT